MAGDQHGGQGGDRSEHAEGDGLGLDGPLCFGRGDRGVADVEARVWGKNLLDLCLHCGDVAAAVIELEPAERPAGAALEQGSRELRRQEQTPREMLGVVLHDLVVQHPDPDDGDVGAQVRLHARRSVAAGVPLVVGVETQRNDRPHVQPELASDVRGRDPLARTLRIRQAALRNDDAILVEEQTIDTAHRVRQSVLHGSAVGSHLEHVGRGDVLDVSHVRQMRDRVDKRGVIASGSAAVDGG